MRMGEGIRTGLGHGGITSVLQTQFSFFFFFFFFRFSFSQIRLLVAKCFTYRRDDYTEILKRCLICRELFKLRLKNEWALNPVYIYMMQFLLWK